MQSKKIIENIHSIYDEYAVPQNVRMHMMRVAAVAEIICDNINPKIDSSDLVAVSLIHDLGNIVKFDFSHKEKILLLEKKDRENIEFLKKKQKEFFEKYGENDIVANKLIAEEIGVNKRVLYLLKNKEIEYSETNFWVNDLELMILFYTDLRVAPRGVTSMKKRIEEYAKRNLFEKDPLQAEKSKKFTIFALDIEKKIFAHLNFKPNYITNKIIEKYVKKYQKNLEL